MTSPDHPFVDNAACGDTWYYLDLGSGTPIRCAGGKRLECATAPGGEKNEDGSPKCQWGRLFETPHAYQPLLGIVSGETPHYKNCGYTWTDAARSFDPCEELGCNLEPSHENFCRPRVPHPAIRIHTGLLVSYFVNSEGRVRETENQYNVYHPQLLATYTVLMSIGVLLLVLCAALITCCCLRRSARRRIAELLRQRSRLAYELASARAELGLRSEQQDGSDDGELAAERSWCGSSTRRHSRDPSDRGRVQAAPAAVESPGSSVELASVQLASWDVMFVEPEDDGRQL